MKDQQASRKFPALILVLLVIAAGIFSCVPNKQISYVQDKSVEDISLLPKDTVVKTLWLKEFEHRLKPEDILSIRVRTLLETEEELNYFNLGMGGSQGGQQQNQMMMGPGAAALSGYIVDSQGNIDLPVHGKLYVQGKTLEEVKNEIQVIARESIGSDVVVDVRMMNFQLYILGAVGPSAIYQTFLPRLNILEALSLAGGLPIDADRENIKLYRRDGLKVELIIINLLDDKLFTSDYFYLKPNDMLVVDPLPVRNVTLAQSTVTTAIGFGLTIFNLILLLSR
ncbi:polysaccharide biosynthesis/export family protein [Peijinzhouia sedimentorum]